MSDSDKPENIAAALAEREMNALRQRERLTDDQVAQRWAQMAVVLRNQDNLPDVLDRVCLQAIEANAIRAALAEALDAWERENAPTDGDVLPSVGETEARIASLRAKFLGKP